MRYLHLPAKELDEVPVLQIFKAASHQLTHTHRRADDSVLMHMVLIKTLCTRVPRQHDDDKHKDRRGPHREQLRHNHGHN